MKQTCEEEVAAGPIYNVQRADQYGNYKLHSGIKLEKLLTCNVKNYDIKMFMINLQLLLQEEEAQ